MAEDFKQPTRLALWINDHYWIFFSLVMLGMAAVFIGDLINLPGHHYLPWLPPLEVGACFIFTPLIRWTKRKIPYLSMATPMGFMLGHFGLILSLVMIPVVWGFQALSWMVSDHYQGAAFYWPSLILAVVLAYRQKSTAPRE